MIKAVLFDVDGVLIDSFEANLRFYQNLMAYTGYSGPTREEFKDLFHRTLPDVIRILTRSESEEEIGRIWELGRTRAAGYPTELITLSEGAAETLAVLLQRYMLGVVTSRINVWEGPFAALKDVFQTVVNYQDTVEHKPHPAPLLLAAERLGVPPAACVYVGDAASDVAAGHAAGMKVIIYNSSETQGADKAIRKFSELPGEINSFV